MSDHAENLSICDDTNPHILNITEDALLDEITVENGWQPLEDKQPNDHTYPELEKVWKCSNRTVANRALQLENEGKAKRMDVMNEFGRRVRVLRFLQTK